MTQEDRELLLRDLCARLPYGLYVQDEYGDIICINYNIWKENYKGMTVKYTPNDKSYLAIGISSMQRDMIDRFNEDILLG